MKRTSRQAARTGRIANQAKYVLGSGFIIVSPIDCAERKLVRYRNCVYVGIRDGFDWKVSYSRGRCNWQARKLISMYSSMQRNVHHLELFDPTLSHSYLFLTWIGRAKSCVYQCALGYRIYDFHPVFCQGCQTSHVKGKRRTGCIECYFISQCVRHKNRNYGVGPRGPGLGLQIFRGGKFFLKVFFARANFRRW